MRATFAFDVCHDVYRAAREVIDTKIPTMNLESSGKYLWRPDRMPHLNEYVADFAIAGERALLGGRRDQKRRRASSRRAFKDGVEQNAFRMNPSQNTLGTRASRMTMFRVFYLGGAEYSAARRHLGISEPTGPTGPMRFADRLDAS